MNERSLQLSSLTPGEFEVARGWRFALPVLVLTLLAILVLYRETAMDMVEIWQRSETFTHGFLVPPISLWLIWRMRDQLARLTPRPNPWLLPALAVTGLVWLMAELATVGVLAQFALTTLLVLAVPAVLGLPLARRSAFPLAFLYFAVPFGEFALPQLMEWTADFTVLGLRLTGIPVFREGLHFVIPTGNWSVIEACSGVRYLIASLSIGTLFAYLNYQSLKRRLLFVAVAFVVPVIANWMRAYMIVMIGHLSGNKLAVGVDHLIYGWVFFGVVIMLMFWIGSRWREDELPMPQDCAVGASSGVVVRNSSLATVAFLVVVLAAVWPLANWQIARDVPAEVPPLELPGAFPGWPAAAETTSGWSPRFENPSAVLQSAFGADGRTVGLYLGYYRHQDDRRKMVTSSNVLVASGDSLWVTVASGSRPILLDRQALAVRTAELKAADSSRLVVWQWYWVNGHLTASDFMAKVYTAWSRLRGQGDDSAVVIVYAPKEQAGRGEAALDAFVNAAWPDLDRALRQTRDRR